MNAKVKYKLTFEKYIKKVQNNIRKNADSLWLPNTNLNTTHKESNSWFDIKVYNNNTHKNIPTDKQINIPIDKINKPIKCNKIKLSLTDKQMKVINNWINAYTKVYNETILYINQQYRNNKDFKCTFYDLRKQMSPIIIENMNKSKRLSEYIQKLYKLKGKKTNYAVKRHILDQAVATVLAHYKTCKTNLKKGHISYFYLRKLKKDRKNKVMKIEKSFFNKDGLCAKLLGKTKGRIVNDKIKNKIFNFKDVNCDCILKHDIDTNEYFLFVPENIPNIEINNGNKKQLISIDPGLRTFITGITEVNIIEIGTNIIDTVKKHLKVIDKFENKITNEQIKKRKIRNEKRKLKNKVDDFHWKTIKYLTDNHKHIMIGNLSTKKIVNKSGTFKSGIYKRAALESRLYEFKQRLQYKCSINNVGYKEVNEYYTSKMCSMCGKINNVGDSKVYNCNDCKMTVDRDVNGARNIYFKRNLK